MKRASPDFEVEGLYQNAALPGPVRVELLDELLEGHVNPPLGKAD